MINTYKIIIHNIATMLQQQLHYIIRKNTTNND